MLTHGPRQVSSQLKSTLSGRRNSDARDGRYSAKILDHACFLVWLVCDRQFRNGFCDDVPIRLVPACRARFSSSPRSWLHDSRRILTISSAAPPEGRCRFHDRSVRFRHNNCCRYSSFDRDRISLYLQRNLIDELRKRSSNGVLPLAPLIVSNR